MKQSILIAAMIFGFSFQALADDHTGDAQGAATTETTTTKKMKKTTSEKAMSAKDAEAACKKEGKAGADLATCIKSHSSAH